MCPNCKYVFEIHKKYMAPVLMLYTGAKQLHYFHFVWKSYLGSKVCQLRVALLEIAKALHHRRSYMVLDFKCFIQVFFRNIAA